MKSAMPYYGIRMPELRKICRASFRQYHLEPDDWEATALALWRNAKHREERYAALELIGHRPWHSYFQPPLLTTLEEFVVTGAWWDYVDSVAVNFVGHLLERGKIATSLLLELRGEATREAKTGQ